MIALTTNPHPQYPSHPSVSPSGHQSEFTPIPPNPTPAPTTASSNSPTAETLESRKAVSWSLLFSVLSTALIWPIGIFSWVFLVRSVLAYRDEDHADVREATSVIRKLFAASVIVVLVIAFILAIAMMVGSGGDGVS